MSSSCKLKNEDELFKRNKTQIMMLFELYFKVICQDGINRYYSEYAFFLYFLMIVTFLCRFQTSPA